MRAYRGRVQGGKIELEEGVRLPEGAIVTVTIGEREWWSAKLRAAWRHRRWLPLAEPNPRTPPP